MHQQTISTLYLPQRVFIQQERLFQDTEREAQAMSNHPDLDPATSQFLTQFKRGLKSARDVSRELDTNKSLRAGGGFSFVYKTRWAPPGAQPIEVSLTLCPRCKSMK